MADQRKLVEERQNEFVTYFVEEFEAKLHAYHLILEGKLEKAGFYSDKFSGIIGQAIGGIPTGLIGLFSGAPGVAAAGAAAGKEVAEIVGRAIGSKHHKKKVIRLISLVNRFLKDKANFRQELVEAGFKIFLSYEMQFMEVTTDQGPKKAMQLVARDATNRLISYNVEHKDFKWKNVIEGIVLGKSKIDWGLPFDGHNIRTNGFELDTIDSSEKWSTSSMFEKVGIIRKGAYYEKKDSRTAKYGYRRLLDSEDWNKLSGNYCETKDVQNYQYVLTLPDLEHQNIIKDILDQINRNDKDLMEKRITELIEEVIKDVNSLKTENFKILGNIQVYLKNINVNEYFNKFERCFENNEKDHEKVIELIVGFTKNHKRAIQLFIISIIILAIALLTHQKVSFNSMERRQDIYHGDNKNEHKNTQELIKTSLKDQKQIIESIETGREENAENFTQLEQKIDIHDEDNKKEHKKTQHIIETSFVKLKSKRVEQSVLFDVKDPVYQFTGRKEELSDLHSKIYHNPERATVITQMKSISGLGGIGKTELARKYIKDHGEDFDYIMWINSESEATIMESFSRLAKDKLHIEARDENEKEKNIKTIVEDVYTFLSKNVSLIIFDNVEKNDDVIKLLRTFCTVRQFLPIPSEKPHILITSRNREWKEGIEILTLNVLKLQDAIDLVHRRIYGRYEETKALVEKLQCFPLALQQAIAYIEYRGLMTTYRVSNYLEKYEKKAQDLLGSKIFKGIDNDYERATYITWKISIDEITNYEVHGKLALDILNTIAYLAPENINRKMLLVLAKSDESKLMEALRMLVQYSLVNSEEKQSEISIHSLVQKLTRLELKGQNQEEKVLKEVLELMESNFPFNSDKSEDYAKKRQQLPHLETFTYHIDQWIETKPQNTREIEENFLAKLLTWTSDAYNDFGDHETQKELLERALAIKEKHYGSDHLQVATTLEYLGNAYEALGNRQNEKELLERSLRIKQNHYGPEHIEVAATLVNLSSTYEALGDIQKQKESLEMALSIHEKHYGSTHIKVATLVENLGNVYGALGNHKREKELLERALPIKQKHYGSEHCQVAITLANLGIAYAALGDYQKQKDLLERALKIEEKQYGSEHFQLASTLSNLGNAYGALGYPHKGKELMERALAIKEKHYGSEHFQVAKTLVNLGKAYRALGEPIKGKELIKRALAINEKYYGSDHIRVATILASLGTAYGAFGDNQEKKVLLEKALAIKEKHYGSEHFQVASTLANLGNAYGALGDPQKKKELLEKALAIKEKHYGSDHFRLATTLANLGDAYGALGYPQKKKELLEKALAIKEKHYGSEDFQLASTLANLGNAYAALGNIQKRKELMERALGIKKKHYGSEHFQVDLGLLGRVFVETLEKIASFFGLG